MVLITGERITRYSPNRWRNETGHGPNRRRKEKWTRSSLSGECKLATLTFNGPLDVKLSVINRLILDTAEASMVKTNVKKKI